MNDEQMRDLFREMREEPLPADSLARVRMAVAKRIAQPARRPWWLQWQVLAAGVVGMAMIAMLVSGPDPVQKPAPMEARKEAPVEVRVQAPVDAPRVKPVQAKARQKAERQDALIRLETADPNVVILLVAEGAGE